MVSLTEIAESLGDDHGVVGYRFVAKWDSGRPNVGDQLAPSNEWDGDELTDVELAGTSTFAEWADLERYARHSKGNGWVVLAGGEDCGWGQEAGERIIGDAVVLAVMDW